MGERNPRRIEDFDDVPWGTGPYNRPNDRASQEARDRYGRPGRYYERRNSDYKHEGTGYDRDHDEFTRGYQKYQQQQRQPQPPVQRQQPRRDGQGSADAYGAASPQEQDRMLRGAFQAGINGDDGAMQSFPNTPFGQRLRQEFMRGRQQRQKPQRGLGFSSLDRG